MYVDTNNHEANLLLKYFGYGLCFALITIFVIQVNIYIYVAVYRRSFSSMIKGEVRRFTEKCVIRSIKLIINTGKYRTNSKSVCEKLSLSASSFCSYFVFHSLYTETIYINAHREFTICVNGCRFTDVSTFVVYLILYAVHKPEISIIDLN